MYVLIVLAWLGAEQKLELAAHDFNDPTICRVAAMNLAKHYPQYHLVAFCEPKGKEI